MSDEFDFFFDSGKNLWRRSSTSGAVERFHGLTADWKENWEPGVMPDSATIAGPELAGFWAYVWSGAS